MTDLAKGEALRANTQNPREVTTVQLKKKAAGSTRRKEAECQATESPGGWGMKVSEGANRIRLWVMYSFQYVLL